MHCEDALGGADASRKHIGLAKSHCEDTLGRRNALRRRIGVAKTALGDTLRDYGPGSRRRIAKLLSRHNSTSTIRGQLHMHDSHDSLLSMGFADVKIKCSPSVQGSIQRDPVV